MPRIQHITTNFSAGEWAPRLRGRVDLEKFNSSAEKLTNCVVLRQGGVTMRPSMDFKGAVKDSAQTPRPIAFVYSRTDAFVLEFGDGYMRVWDQGVLVETSPGVPYEIATPYTDEQLAEVDFTQGGDTLLLFHQDVPTQRLRRFSATNWIMDAAPFKPGPIYEFGVASSTITLTLSAATVGAGRTVTASAATFLASDVGRTITSAGGVLTITGFTSTTVVTGTISLAFQGTLLAASEWRLQGSPQTTCTPSADKPLGATITLTLGADGWRAIDATQGYVEINGGLVKLGALTSATVISGVIERELTGTTAAPADAWVLLGPAWNEFDGYPKTGTLMQQRLWAAGTPGFPLSFWGSRTGLFFDFTPGTLDDSSVYKTIDSDDNNIIQHLVAGWGSLIGLTYGGEFEVRGGIEKPITQLNAQIIKRSHFGASTCRPEEVGTDMLFVERGGTAIRSIQQDIERGIVSIDVSVFSDHLLGDGIVAMSFEQKPETVVWCVTGSGRILALTYNSEQTQVSICSAEPTGVCEWVVTVPEGEIDASYALMRRVVNGATLRYLERLNWSAYPGMDSRKQVTGAASTTWAGFDHLEGETVAVLADDIYMGAQEVTGGVITLPREATKVAAGLPYTSVVRMSAPEIGTGTGTAQGQAVSTNRVWVRFLNTIGAKSNLQELGFQQFDGPLLDVAPAAFSGVKSTSDYGWDDGESPIEITQDLPYPWTVLSIVRNVTINQG